MLSSPRSSSQRTAQRKVFQTGIFEGRVKPSVATSWHPRRLEASFSACFTPRRQPRRRTVSEPMRDVMEQFYTHTADRESTSWNSNLCRNDQNINFMLLEPYILLIKINVTNVHCLCYLTQFNNK